MATRKASPRRIALSLLGAARGRALTAPMLVGAGALLGCSPNAMRVALSRLASASEVELEGRGRYALARSGLDAFAHVRTYRTGFAPRVPWQGGFVGVLTADLPRRNPTAVRRRERALDLVGMRRFRHGLHLRPDNLEGGAPRLAAHLLRLGLDESADVIGVTLDAAAAREVERLYDVREDATRANRLESKVRAMLATMDRRPRRRVAAECFWLGDEALRMLARDPLLPESIADPSPRRALADAMAELDERGHALWRAILDELEHGDVREGESP